MVGEVGDASALDGEVQADLKGTGLPASTILYYLLPGEAPENVNGLLSVTARIDGSLLGVAEYDVDRSVLSCVTPLRLHNSKAMKCSSMCCRCSATQCKTKEEVT